MKITIGNIFTSLLFILWLIWTVYVFKRFFKYHIKNLTKDTPPVTFIEALWWLINIFVPIGVLVCWIIIKIIEFVSINWDKSI